MTHEDLWRILGGAIGTILAGLVGYLVWQRQQGIARRDKFLQERGVAYRALWEKLQEFEAAVRIRSGFLRSELEEYTREVNILIMKHEIFLEPDDRQLATAYLEASFRVAREFDINGTKEDIAWFSTTACGPPPNPAFRDTVIEMFRARDLVLDRVRHAQGGPPVARPQAIVAITQARDETEL